MAGDPSVLAEIDSFVEYYWNRMQEEPSLERLRAEFPKVDQAALKKQVKLSLDKLLTKGYNVTKKNYLEPKQLALANALLNLDDRRSQKKKMDDLQVSPAMFANWKKNPAFNDYMRERSEELLSGGVTGAHLALVETAATGDVSAIKLLYEITGRHTSGSQQIENVKVMLTRVIEAVQRHVKDPAILQAIANEIQLTKS